MERGQEKGDSTGGHLAQPFPQPPCYEPLSSPCHHHPPPQEVTEPSPPPYPGGLQPFLGAKRWERVFFLWVPQLSCSPPLHGWHSPTSIAPITSAPVRTLLVPDLISVQQEGKGKRKRRRKATKRTGT